MQRLRQGDPLPTFQITTIQGRVIRDTELRGHPTLIAFHRYARCAICNQRIRELTRELPNVQTCTGLRVLFVCHSDRRRLLAEFGERDLPFELIDDPQRSLYQAFGVAQSLATTLKPASVISIFRARKQMPKDGKPAGLERPLTMIPADFLIDAQGIVRSAHYGKFLGDSWPIETIGRLAAEPATAPNAAPNAAAQS